MPAIPEFVLRKLVVPNSLKEEGDGFSLQINNTFAPASLLGFSLSVNGQKVPPQKISIESSGNPPVNAESINLENPFALSVGVVLNVKIKETPLGEGDIHFEIETREVGSLAFSLKGSAQKSTGAARKKGLLSGLLKRPVKVDIRINKEDRIGEVSPLVYGQFIEHLERCIYGGIWNDEGSELRPDVVELIKELRPPIIRYPGGNFASGYHWEDGIGPKEQRPQRVDKAWNATDSNQVGTDEFLAFCREVETEPFLVVNTGNGTPQEAANWVAYCNDPAESEQGQRRAANGHPEPYNVRYWGVGNEVWGAWQIGHTDAESHAAQLNEFALAMKAVDPSICIIAVGDGILSDDPQDKGRQWNEIMLKQAGESMDMLSFHLYQPDQSSWQESYDMDELHHVVCAAPLAAEKMIKRMAEQINEAQPDKKIGIAFDEWNLWLPPGDEAESMHQVKYCLRDALYTASMLNVFVRQCQPLQMANLAQLVNVLPLIVTNDTQAFATPPYHVFKMHLEMQKFALKAHVAGKYFDSVQMGNIPALKDVPYLDAAVTCDEEGKKLVICMVNRHPEERAFVNINLEGFGKMKLSGGQVLRGEDLLAVNSFEEPEKVKPKTVMMPPKSGKAFRLDVSPACVATLILEAE